MEQDVPRAALAVMEVEKIVAASFGEGMYILIVGFQCHTPTFCSLHCFGNIKIKMLRKIK